MDKKNFMQIATIQVIDSRSNYWRQSNTLKRRQQKRGLLCIRENTQKSVKTISQSHKIKLLILSLCSGEESTPNPENQSKNEDFEFPVLAWQTLQYIMCQQKKIGVVSQFWHIKNCSSVLLTDFGPSFSCLYHMFRSVPSFFDS